MSAFRLPHFMIFLSRRNLIPLMHDHYLYNHYYLTPETSITLLLLRHRGLLSLYDTHRVE